MGSQQSLQASSNSLALTGFCAKCRKEQCRHLATKGFCKFLNASGRPCPYCHCPTESPQRLGVKNAIVKNTFVDLADESQEGIVTQRRQSAPAALTFGRRQRSGLAALGTLLDGMHETLHKDAHYVGARARVGKRVHPDVLRVFCEALICELKATGAHGMRRLRGWRGVEGIEHSDSETGTDCGAQWRASHKLLGIKVWLAAREKQI